MNSSYNSQRLFGNSIMLTERILSAERMQSLDQATIDMGISGAVLMERAALSMEQALQRRHARRPFSEVHIFCGSGNNGGDGLVLGRLLSTQKWKNKGVSVHVYARAPKSPENQNQQQVLQHLGINIRAFENRECADLFPKHLSPDVLCIDALLGIGLSRPVKGPLEAWITYLNQQPCQRVALDISSGLHADTGQVLGVAFKADLTLACGYAKQAHYMDQALDHVGELEVVDIGIPEALAQKSEEKDAQLITARLLRACFPVRSASMHKNQVGRLGIVGGSEGMQGAFILAATGALESGVGMTFGYTENTHLQALAPHLPEVQLKAHHAVFDELRSLDTLLIGPGLGRSQSSQALCHRLFSEAEKHKLPLVIDADGLYHLKTWLENGEHVLPETSILTPHPGEAAHLLGTSSKQVQADRMGTLKDLSQKMGVTVILKGARTLIADEQEIFINPTGNPGLARGGAGDVLAGMTAGLLAQRVPYAACVSTYWHGAAADRLAATHGFCGVRLPRLCETLGPTISELLCVEDACNSAKQR